MTPASPTLPLLQSLHDVTVHWPSKGETVKSASVLPATLLFTYRWRQWRQICSLKIFIAFAILFSAARIPVRMPRLLQNESLRAVGMLGRGTSVSITAVDPLEHLDRLGCGCGVTRQLSLTFPEMGALGWRPGNTIITSHWHTRGTDFRQQNSRCRHHVQAEKDQFWHHPHRSDRTLLAMCSHSWSCRMRRTGRGGLNWLGEIRCVDICWTDKCSRVRVSVCLVRSSWTGTVGKTPRCLPFSSASSLWYLQGPDTTSASGMSIAVEYCSQMSQNLQFQELMIAKVQFT